MMARSFDGNATPGPWNAKPFRVVVQTTNGPVEGPLMSYLAGSKHTAPGMTVSIASERVADHHLCAAAPDLLAVLCMVKEAASTQRGEDFNLSVEQWAAFHAAIAKAVP